MARRDAWFLSGRKRPRSMSMRQPSSHASRCGSVLLSVDDFSLKVPARSDGEEADQSSSRVEDESLSEKKSSSELSLAAGTVALVLAEAKLRKETCSAKRAAVDFRKVGTSRGMPPHLEEKCSASEVLVRLAANAMSNATFRAPLAAPAIRLLERTRDMGAGLSHHFIDKAYR